MVAIFTGLGAGFERGSANVLGAGGIWGSGVQGRSGDQVAVNAATGNLVVSRQDEFLIGRGPDVGISRTYNSMLDVADNDNGDNWRQSTDRRVYDLVGTINTAGSTLKRVGADGAVVLYTYDAGESAYIATDGAGAYDRITSSGSVWIWRDGDSQTVEWYDSSNGGRITWQGDVDGNWVEFTYNGSGLLDKVITADGSWTQYSWSGTDITAIVTGFTDLQTSTAKTLTRTYYVYDGSHRLTTVKVDYTPDDNSVADSAFYQVDYSYDGSGRLSQISQSDGSLVAFAYDGSGRVITVTQTASTGVTRVTAIAYDTNETIVTDPRGGETQLTYDSNGQLVQLVAPSDDNGLRQIVQYEYDADGNLVRTISTDSDAASIIFYDYTPGEVDNDVWPDDPNSLPTAGTLPSGWLSNSHIDDTEWAATTGPYGNDIVSLHGGQVNSDGSAGGSFSNLFEIDPEEAYEFSYYVKYDSAGIISSVTYFGMRNYLSEVFEDAVTGSSTNNPYFATISPSSNGLVADRWYKVVGYVLPEGSANLSAHDLGGVYDTITGAKILSTTSWRWADGTRSDYFYSRFFRSGPSGTTSYETHYFLPDVRVIDPADMLGGSDTLDTATDAAYMAAALGAASVPGPSGIIYDEGGRITSYTYDGNGNWLTRTDANDHVTTRTYGSKNEVLSEAMTGSDAGGASVSHVSRFVYDSENHLRYAISAEGHVTEYLYSASGLLNYIIEYPEHSYTTA
ncbi:MAG: hypothetical protein R3E02_15925, partial [Blastomonas sp.]